MSQRRYYSRESRLQAKRERSFLIMVALSVGIGIGSIIALLFAPTEGEQMREDLTENIETRMEHLQHQVEDLRSKFEKRLSNLA